jgi:hypothetical protein
MIYSSIQPLKLEIRIGHILSKSSTRKLCCHFGSEFQPPPLGLQILNAKNELLPLFQRTKYTSFLYNWRLFLSYTILKLYFM